MSRVPDAVQRATLLRRAGTQNAWTPALQRTFHAALRPGNGGYRPFTFRHTAKSVNVCSSVAG